MNLMYFMCNERNHNICYTTATYEVHFLKNQKKKKKKKKKIIVKGHFCLSFSRLCRFIRSCKFVIIEARAYNIAHDENVMS